MNIDRLTQLAAHIETLPHATGSFFNEGSDAPLTNFNMVAYKCGTAGCIAGWALHLFRPESDAHDYDHAFEYTEKLLGVRGKDESLEIYHLCHPPIADRWEDITPAMAAKAIRNVISIGTPNWGEIVEDHLNGRD